MRWGAAEENPLGVKGRAETGRAANVVSSFQTIYRPHLSARLSAFLLRVLPSVLSDWCCPDGDYHVCFLQGWNNLSTYTLKF